MNSAYAVLKRLTQPKADGTPRRFVLGSVIETVYPHNPRPESILVRDNWDRGGEIRHVRVNTSTDKASVYVCTADEQVEDTENGKTQFTSPIVAMHDGTKFNYVNHFFYVEVDEQELYEQLVVLRVVPRNAPWANQLIRLDLRPIPVFENIIPDLGFITDKVRVLSLASELSKLRSFKSRANKYFRDNNIEFPELDKPRKAKEVAEGEQEETAQVEVPVTLFTVALPDDKVEVVINFDQYRSGQKKGYTQIGYGRCKDRIAAIKQQLEPLCQRVRVAELGFLEHSPEINEVLLEDAQGATHRITFKLIEGYETKTVPASAAQNYVQRNPAAALV